MNYQSPIEVINTQIQSQIEGEIYKAVMRVGVSVDKEELLKALAYDRNQYQKGYTDRDSEIIRCKDCRFWHEAEIYKGFGGCGQGNGIPLKPSDWFCADGRIRQ